MNWQRLKYLALLLAAVGITGVVGMVLRGSTTWVLAGLAVGILGSMGTARVLGTLLFEVRPADPGVLAVVSAALGGVALRASLVPALRAAHLDPMRVLHRE